MKVPWNKGLTKETNERVKKYSNNLVRNSKISKKRKGIVFSESHRKNISKSKIGKTTWNKGKKTSEETKNKISKSLKGKKQTKETIDKKISTRKFNGWFKDREKTLSLKMKDKHWNWKGGITPLIRQIRNCFEYRQWRCDIFTRDDFTCQKCLKRGGSLEAHHIIEFSKIIIKNNILNYEQALNCEELWNINNGITLCSSCHLNKHKRMVVRKNGKQ